MPPSSRHKIFLLATAVVILFVVAFQPTAAALPVVADATTTYSAKCAKCHGADGRGVEKYKKKGVKDFTDAKWQKSRSDAQLTAAINNGKGEVMPAWKTKLSAEEVNALVAHVRTFGKH